MVSIKSVLSFVALASITTFSVVACQANTDASPDDDETGSVQSEELKKSITSCSVDDDCVAVPRGGCCQNGWNEAVNKHHTKAYANATKCTLNPRPMCPMYMVHDTRVAQCDTAKKQCKMFEIDEIKCGGFMMNSHQCPTGYSCDHTGVNPDLPGKCVQDPPPPPPPSDCRATGCGTGKYCSACWGHFACIPNGALC